MKDKNKQQQTEECTEYTELLKRINNYSDLISKLDKVKKELHINEPEIFELLRKRKTDFNSLSLIK